MKLPVLSSAVTFLILNLSLSNTSTTTKPKAWVILPDHFHIIINSQHIGISKLLHSFKRTYTWNYNLNITSGRVWQNRFWDHLIRDELDLKHHLDYIHYNPVKHQFVDDPFKYRYSSIHDFQKKGIYQSDWGNGLEFENELFGE